MKIPHWSVKKVIAREDYTLLITFADGTKKVYDAKPLLDIKIFQPLRNPALFMQAHVSYGTVIWNDDLDIAPEHLYECGKPYTA